jgi:hypothetical protein
LSELAILSKKLISKLRVADYRGASVAVDWPAELPQRVRDVAREHNATSFMVIQAALAVLLSKISASSEVPVRPRGSGGMVEFRTDVFDAASIEALVERLRRVLVAMTADSGNGS